MYWPQCLCFADVETCEVTTSSGVIEGTVTHSPEDGEEIQQFLGIPYAKAPVGRRRFADPDPIGKFFKSRLTIVQLDTSYTYSS